MSLDKNIDKLENFRRKIEPYNDAELNRLAHVSFLVLIWLLSIILYCAFKMHDDTLDVISKFSIYGVLGSTTSALLSALQRRANGFELENGDPYPPLEDSEPTENKEKFNLRMVTFFVFRPFLGIAAGLIVLYGNDYILQTGLNVNQLNTNTQNDLIFYAILAGLFSKSLFEKLKNVFKSIFGRV